MLKFFVEGIPATAGSKRSLSIWKGSNKASPVVESWKGLTLLGVAWKDTVVSEFHKLLMVDSHYNPLLRTFDDNEKGAAWKRQVQKAAKLSHTGEPFTGPLELQLEFVRQRPAGHWTGTGNVSKKGRESFAPIAKPDVLKLARCVEDALTGILYVDDAQIVRELLIKRWAREGEREGVQISICSHLPDA